MKKKAKGGGLVGYPQSVSALEGGMESLATSWPHYYKSKAVIKEKRIG